MFSLRGLPRRLLNPCTNNNIIAAYHLSSSYTSTHTGGRTLSSLGRCRGTSRVIASLHDSFHQQYYYSPSESLFPVNLVRRHVGSSSSSGHHGAHHRGNRGRGESRGGKLNEFGHDYNQVGGPINTSVCTLSETEIHNIIRARSECRRKRDFQGADKILDELQQHGVVIRDEAKAWRADGMSSFPRERSARNTKNTNKIPNMNDCDTLDEAIKAMHDNLDKVSSRNLSAFWTVVPKFLKYERVGKLNPQLQAISKKTADKIGNYGPRDLAQTTLAFAKIVKSLKETEGRNNGRGGSSYHEFLHNTLIGEGDIIFQFIANTARPKLSQFEPQAIANLAYAYAIIECVPKFDDGSTLFHHIAEQIIRLLGKFKPQALSNIVWAFEKVKVSHPELFEKVGDNITSLDHLRDFAPQALSNILIAFGKAEVPHPEMFKKVGDHITDLAHLNNFIPLDLSLTVWAFSKAEVSHLDLFEKVGDHITSLDNLREFDPQALANIVWAFAKAGVSHPRLMKKVGNYITSLDNLDDFSAQDISNLVWGFAKLDVHNTTLYDKLTDVAVEEKSDDFSNQDIENLLRWTK